MNADVIETAPASSATAYGIDRAKVPLSARAKLEECAEVFIATSGAIALVSIVLIVAMMMRAFRSFRAR